MFPTGKKITAALALLLALPLSAQAAKIDMVTEGAMTGISGWDPTRKTEDNLKGAGGEASLYLQPIVSFKGGRWLITPNYDFNYSNISQVLAVDENVFLYNQYLSNLFELGGAWRSPSGQRVGLKVFHTAINGTTATNESLSTGLYNYNDTGVKASWGKKTESKSNYSVGVSAYGRKYPHYITLDPSQRHEKDASVFKFNADADINWHTNHNFMTQVSYSLQSLAYADAPIVDETGTTNTAADGSGTMRKDLVHSFGLTLPFEFGQSKWGIGYSLESRTSNFNYFDARQSVYMANYNDYNEHGLLLSFAYDFEKPWWFLLSPELTLDADMHYRLYNTRQAKKSDGTYELLPPLEVDNRYQARIGFNSPVSQHWSGNASMDFLGVTSNNLDASTSIVNYKFYTLRVGAQFNY